MAVVSSGASRFRESQVPEPSYRLTLWPICNVLLAHDMSAIVTSRSSPTQDGANLISMRRG